MGRQIFSQQQSLFKFAPIRCGRGEKTTYCLACLISLVEQVSSFSHLWLVKYDLIFLFDLPFFII